MPTDDWLKTHFNYGYDSGDVLAETPDSTRAAEERYIGGSYHAYFRQVLAPKIDPAHTVLELGPGAGSWTRAVLSLVTTGSVHTCDFQDVTPWLKPEQYGRRLTCHRVCDNSFSVLEDASIDMFFSVGVLCHCTLAMIGEIFTNSLRKMRPGALSVHHYGDWDKLERRGFAVSGVPEEFRDLPDEEIWWPRNNPARMSAAASAAGWRVLQGDVGCFERDSVIVLQRPPG